MKPAAACLLFLTSLTAQQNPAEPTPAQLAQRLLDPGHRRAAAVALLRLGEPGAAALAALLANPKVAAEGEDLIARETAIEVLDQLGPRALPALWALLDCLVRPDHQGLRSRILAAIGHCVPWHPEYAKETARTLGKAATDNTFLGIDGFFATLSRLQFDAAQDRAALLTGLGDRNPWAREAAAEALELSARDIDNAARAPVIRALQAALQDDPPTTFSISWDWNGSTASSTGGCNNKEAFHAAVSRALLALDPSLPETVPGHRALLKHLDPRVRQEAARALGLLGPAADDAAGPLVLVLEDPEPAVAREAASALGLIGKLDEVVRQGLEHAMASTDKQLAARAKAALAQLERSRR
jgi:HEAT repeat protein